MATGAMDLNPDLGCNRATDLDTPRPSTTARAKVNMALGSSKALPDLYGMMAAWPLVLTHTPGICTDFSGKQKPLIFT